MDRLSGISNQIWDMKYRFKDQDDVPIDQDWQDTAARVATALAVPEKAGTEAQWQRQFLGAISGLEFLPAGRIIAGAGTDRSVTLFNCFVMGTIPDSMEGIFQNLKEAALTLQQGGGIGYDFSTLRPNGALVQGVAADASGPLSFMDVWDAMCGTIMSAGSRRGAMMATLSCDHPDIEAFIEAKQDPDRLRMFNLSVLVSDAFMAAVKTHDSWGLAFDGQVYKTVEARALWDKIMRSTYAYAEPGVIFIDRINQRNNLHYCETIRATNPCVTGDTWVQTSDGPRQVEQLRGRPFHALVDGNRFSSTEEGFFVTGIKPVFRLQTRQGYTLRLTSNHLVRKVRRKTRWQLDVEWSAVEDLVPGDQVILHDHRSSVSWLGFGSEEQGYLIGLLIGEGTLKSDKAVLSVWPGRQVVNGGFERPGVAGVMETALAAANNLPHRSDFKGWSEVPGRGEQRLALASVKKLAHQLGLEPGHKNLTPTIEQSSSDFYKGFLRGFFDADGSVQGDQKKGVSVRLTQSNHETLLTIQRMLLRLGIVSSIYTNRHPARTKSLPDGRGGKQPYDCAAVHELVVSRENVARFFEIVGFADTEKRDRLRALISSYNRRLNRERFVVEIDSISSDGVETVYDVTVPEKGAFDANGFYVHNCGEQPLPPYGACLLGSINLAQLVRAPFTDKADLDLDRLHELTTTAIRMMDNTIDVSRFPLDAQEKEAKAKRRIGLGVTGLADALIMCRARYGSPESLKLIRSWMGVLRDGAYLASCEIAKEKGAFPLFDREAFLAGETIKQLPQYILERIQKTGIRNALLTSIAPTGTISLLANNVSSGIEPVFSYTYSRKVLLKNGTREEQTVEDFAYRKFREQFGKDAKLPDYFVTTQGLEPKDHIAVQAEVQKFIDSSISKTVNVPEDIAFEDFKDVYQLAWDRGLKGCTTYRPNEITGSVLSVETTPAKGDMDTTEKDAVPSLIVENATPAESVVYMTQPLERPNVLEGNTYKIRWPESDHAMYITMNDIVQDGRRRPFEIFINSKNMEHYAWTVALTRMISAVFRRGGDVTFVVEELKAVFDPRGGQWIKGRYVPSLLAAIGEIIEQHMIDIGFISDKQITEALLLQQEGGEDLEGNPDGSARPKMRSCPKCSAPALTRIEGCDSCLACGYSKCS